MCLQQVLTTFLTSSLQHMHRRGRQSAGCSSASSSRSPSRRRCGRSIPGCPMRRAESPVGGTVLLVGVLDKVGTFGFLRYCLPLFPEGVALVRARGADAVGHRNLLRRFLAIGQRDMKRLVAYTSVAHFGFIAHRHLRLHHSRRHRQPCSTWSTTASRPVPLFLVVGILICAREVAASSPTLAGRQKVTPILAGLFLLAGLSAPRAAGHEHLRQRVPRAGRHVHPLQGGWRSSAPRDHPRPRCTC